MPSSQVQDSLIRTLTSIKSGKNYLQKRQKNLWGGRLNYTLLSSTCSSFTLVSISFFFSSSLAISLTSAAILFLVRSSFVSTLTICVERVVYPVSSCKPWIFSDSSRCIISTKNFGSWWKLVVDTINEFCCDILRSLGTSGNLSSGCILQPQKIRTLWAQDVQVCRSAQSIVALIFTENNSNRGSKKVDAEVNQSFIQNMCRG